MRPMTTDRQGAQNKVPLENFAKKTVSCELPISQGGTRRRGVDSEKEKDTYQVPQSSRTISIKSRLEGRVCLFGAECV